VVKVRTDGDEVGQEVESEPPSVASEVVGSCDWDRRYALMRTPTALHMRAGVLWREDGAQVTGGNRGGVSW
jgi:misacylated tRNA(Ala) deacylase